MGLELKNTNIEGIRVGIKKNGMKYSVRNSRSRFFFPDEWIDFIQSVKSEKRLIYETLVQTGARIEEALNLKPKDIDFIRNNLTLRVTKIKAKKGETIGATRTMPVSSQYIRKIKSYKTKNNISNDSLLFKVTKYSVYQMFKRCLKKSKIEDDWSFSLHNIRKTHGNWLKALEISAEEICTRLGHDFNTYLKHYGSPNIFNRKDKLMMVKILGDVYGLR
jgi:integrase